MPPPEKPKPKAKAKGKVDPEILAIRAEAREKIKDLQRTKNSGSVLNRIINTELKRLTNSDREKLIDHLTNGPGPELAPEPATPSENTPTPWPTEGTMMGED